MRIGRLFILLHDLVFSKRTKHIKLNYHLIREKIQIYLIKTTYIPTNLQVAHVFAKALGCAHFYDLIYKLVRSLYSPSWEGVYVTI